MSLVHRHRTSWRIGSVTVIRTQDEIAAVNSGESTTTRPLGHEVTAWPTLSARNGQQWHFSYLNSELLSWLLMKEKPEEKNHPRMYL